VVFEAFLTLYGLFVLVVELFRQLGLQLGFIGEALTMGQPALYAVILIWHRCDCLALCVSTARPLKISDDERRAAANGSECQSPNHLPWKFPRYLTQAGS
jgi:hypothetical protein